VITVDGSLDRYVEAGNETTKELLEGNGTAVTALRALHEFFSENLWRETEGDRPIPLTLSLSGFTLFLAGVRMALSGHALAVHPLLRTALESACYGFLTAGDESLEPIWTNRHESSEARRECRRAFQAAVPQVAKALNDLQPNSGDLINDAYEAAIDFGAHPNPRSIFPHVRAGDEDDYYVVRLITLYSVDQFEAKRSFLAAVEYGIAIAIVGIRTKATSTQELADKLNEIIDLRDRLEAEIRTIAAE